MVPMFGTQSVTFWYPTSFPQFRTIVRPATSPPLISYFSTTSQPLPTPILNPKKEGGRKEGGRGGSERPPRPSRLTRDDFACPSHVLPTDRQIKGDRRARRASHLRASAGARSLKSN